MFDCGVCKGGKAMTKANAEQINFDLGEAKP
jgi:hypothetical protein